MNNSDWFLMALLCSVVTFIVSILRFHLPTFLDLPGWNSALCYRTEHYSYNCTADSSTGCQHLGVGVTFGLVWYRDLHTSNTFREAQKGDILWWPGRLACCLAPQLLGKAWGIPKWPVKYFLALTSLISDCRHSWELAGITSIFN